MTGIIISIVVILGVLEVLMDLMFNGSMWIAGAILSKSITNITPGQNIIKSFIDLLPFSVDGFVDKLFFKEVLNVESIINGVSYGIYALIIVIAITKSITSPITGEKHENPIRIIINATLTIVLTKILFGSALFNWDGLLAIVGSWMGTVLSSVSGSFNEATLGHHSLSIFSGNPASIIGELLLLASLTSMVIGAAITYIERILSFAISIIIGPIALAMGAYDGTRDISKQWLLSIFSQFMAIFVSLLMWGLFLNQCISMSGINIGPENVKEHIFRMAVAVAILALVKNSEKIFNTWGLRTMPNSESARALIGGAGVIASSAMLAFRTMPTVHNAWKATPSGTMQSSGITNLYDSSGGLSINGDGSFKEKAQNTLGRIGQTAFLGFNSANQKVSNQTAAINAINSMKGLEPGAKMPITNIGGTEYRGSQIANMAMFGNTENKQGLNFIGDKQGNMTYASVKNGDGKVVNGFVGYATYSHNGQVSSTNQMFMPTENYSGDLMKGSTVDIGDGKTWYITGDAQSNGSDKFAYEISSYDTPKVEITNDLLNMNINNPDDISASIYNQYNSDGINPNQSLPPIESPIETREIGKENYLDNDDYNPE